MTITSKGFGSKGSISLTGSNSALTPVTTSALTYSDTAIITVAFNPVLTTGSYTVTVTANIANHNIHYYLVLHFLITFQFLASWLVSLNRYQPSFST